MRKLLLELSWFAGLTIVMAATAASATPTSTVAYRCDRGSTTAFTQFPCVGAKAVKVSPPAGSIDPLTAAERAQLAALARKPRRPVAILVESGEHRLAKHTKMSADGATETNASTSATCTLHRERERLLRLLHASAGHTSSTQKRMPTSSAATACGARVAGKRTVGGKHRARKSPTSKHARKDTRTNNAAG